MAEYSEAVLKKLKTRVSAWSNEFEGSPEYAGLSLAQREDSWFIVEVFCKLMYSYFLQEPETWTASALEECCLDVLPRRVTAEIELYEAVEPVLTAFFAFLHRKGHIANSAELTSRLKEVAGDMVRRAGRPENWGIAKAFMMQALQDGVDIGDDAALDRYVEEYNERSLRSTAGTGGTDVTGGTGRTGGKGGTGGAVRRNKVGRNDPCPCGSGKKYKKCCGASGNVIAFPAQASLAGDSVGNPATPDRQPGPDVYRLKVTIRDIKPPIWRRLLVPQGITFSRLHKIIQAAFGWQDYHLYRFSFGDTVVSLPSPDFPPEELYGDVRVLNARGTKVDELLRARQRCVYIYDFGDNWRHDVVLEAVSTAEEGRVYPACVAGARQRPPEDVGGVGGYEEFLQAISNPKDPRHDEYLLWAEKDTGGTMFDPEYFYILGVNRALAKIK